MTYKEWKIKEKEYKNVERLKEMLEGKFRLDCGHHVTFKHNFATNVVILNYMNHCEIICTSCYD